jgi:hypothetical protein
MDRLEEIGHDMDTQVNEALNNIVAWIAPKNKTYSGSNSLRARISIAIGINSVGFEQFMVELLRRLSITVTPGTLFWIQQQSARREHRKERSQQSRFKKRRNRKIYEKLKQYTRVANMDKAKGTGCATGSNMVEDVEVEVPQSKRRKTNTISNAVCGKCGHKGHSRSSSKKCPKNRLYDNMAEEDVMVLLDDGNEQELMDRLSFDNIADNDLAEDSSEIDADVDEEVLNSVI